MKFDPLYDIISEFGWVKIDYSMGQRYITIDKGRADS